MAVGPQMNWEPFPGLPLSFFPPLPGDPQPFTQPYNPAALVPPALPTQTEAATSNHEGSGDATNTGKRKRVRNSEQMQHNRIAQQKYRWGTEGIFARDW